jgi:CBS domain-containing membrane protein
MNGGKTPPQRRFSGPVLSLLIDSEDKPMTTFRFELPRTQVPLTIRQQMTAAVGAFMGIAACGFAAWMSPSATTVGPLLVAPLGASAVLLFTTPASPMARPWAILVGNTLSATIGVTCALCLAEPVTACATALALSLAMMFLLRCIHPASGAIALTAILGGPDIHNLGYAFALVPVASTSLTLVLAATAYNWLVGRICAMTVEPGDPALSANRGYGS